MFELQRRSIRVFEKNQNRNFNFYFDALSFGQRTEDCIQTCKDTSEEFHGVFFVQKLLLLMMITFTRRIWVSLNFYENSSRTFQNGLGRIQFIFVNQKLLKLLKSFINSSLLGSQMIQITTNPLCQLSHQQVLLKIHLIT